jgi:hypothetical protein
MPRDEKDSVAVTLERIDRIAVAFAEAPAENLGAELTRITGLHFRTEESGSLRADTPAADAWALAARFWIAGDARLLTLVLANSICVRPADVRDDRGAAWRPIPIPPSRNLPAPWHLEYREPWGSLHFGFLSIDKPHQDEDCLVEVLYRQDL